MSSNEKIGIEIERKYIIAMPDEEILATQPMYRKYDILQIYLKSIPGVTRRVRRLKSSTETKYIETVKVRIDQMSSTEVENELTEDEYNDLLELSASDSIPIVKVRHSFVIDSQPFEIDVYPQWKKTAIMENELESREKTVKIPDFIKVISEVTGNKAYSNASMSRSFPMELEI